MVFYAWVAAAVPHGRAPGAVRRLAGRAAILALGMLLLSAGDLTARQWTLDVSIGRAVYERLPVRVDTDNTVLGLRYQSFAGHWLYGSAGVPLGGSSGWAAAGAGRRLLFGGGGFGIRHGLGWGADLGVHAYGFRQPPPADDAAAVREFGGGGTLEILPLLTWRRGAVRLDGQVGWILTGTKLGGSAHTTRALGEGRLGLVYSPAAALQFMALARQVRAEDGDFAYAGGSLWAGYEPVQFWAYAGRWLSAAIAEPDAWGVGAGWVLGERTELTLSLRQESEEPVYWNASRRTWSLGLSRRLGGGGVTRVLPPVVEEGRVTIRIPAAAGEEEMHIAGDFTGWQTVRMARENGFWVVRLALEPGVYHFAFRRGDGSWFVPDTLPHRVSDGMGGESAVLVVR